MTLNDIRILLLTIMFSLSGIILVLGILSALKSKNLNNPTLLGGLASLGAVLIISKFGDILKIFSTT